jgi:hypothetical protein
MTMFTALHTFATRVMPVAAGLTVSLAVALVATPALAQSSIPPNLTQLRPIKCIAYDPKPSDFPQNAYFDSDFFNSDFTGIWGDDGQPGARNDLKTFADAKLNLLHLYNWNAQRVDHTSFLDAALAKGMKVMVPVNNFTAGTIVGQTPGCDCPWGYQAAFNIISGIFNQVYVNGSKAPHPAAAMWGIYNEYDLNRINPVDVAFVAQVIITLEDAAGIPAANRLPITAPVSDAIWYADSRPGAMTREMNVAFARAASDWLKTNPGKNVTTAQPTQLPGAVLSILAVANALSDAQATTSYQSKFDTKGAVNVSAVPADFWKTRWIATSNPFQSGATLENYITNPAQFQSAFPGTTAFNTLPPLFFGEMGRAQKDTYYTLHPPPPSPPAPPPPPWNPAFCDDECKAAQAAYVLDQVTVTNRLASNAANTPQGYFLGSCFFQHSFVDASNYEAWDVVPGSFATRNASSTAPFPAAGKSWRIDVLKPLPVWTSVTQGYATAVEEGDDTELAPDESWGALR